MIHLTTRDWISGIQALVESSFPLLGFLSQKLRLETVTDTLYTTRTLHANEIAQHSRIHCRSDICFDKFHGWPACDTRAYAGRRRGTSFCASVPSFSLFFSPFVLRFRGRIVRFHETIQPMVTILSVISVE